MNENDYYFNGVFISKGNQWFHYIFKKNYLFYFAIGSIIIEQSLQPERELIIPLTIQPYRFVAFRNLNVYYMLL